MNDPRRRRPQSPAADLLAALRELAQPPAGASADEIEARRQLGKSVIEMATRLRSDDDLDAAYHQLAQIIRAHIGGQS